MDNYARRKAALLADKETVFSIDSAHQSLMDVIDLIPKTRRGDALGPCNELGVTLGYCKQLIESSQERV